MNFFSLLLKNDTEYIFYILQKSQRKGGGKKVIFMLSEMNRWTQSKRVEKATLIVDPDWVDCCWEDNPSHLRESERRQEEEGKLCTLCSVLTVKPDRPEHAQWVKAETVIQRTMKKHRTNNCSVGWRNVVRASNHIVFKSWEVGRQKTVLEPFHSVTIIPDVPSLCFWGAKNTMSKIQTIALKKLMCLYLE